MKSLIKILLISLFVVSCSSNKSGDSKVNTDASYGYTEKNPIKVGGFSNGPANERSYLNSLSGPNGETINYERTGSCCAFETKNSPFSGGMLDVYAVTYEGKKDTVVLYLNMYDKASLKAPVGFKFK
ncbi:MAG: hypothetical protein BGO88_14385 [Flavobacterium sp. 38-13]|uniref:2-dehydro-3-deoxyphosphooctonate aldolase n=1 Tax=Flavobacterium sp. 38-13 TaxID=1896168 RepID=UPI000966C6B5|nr:2-dehydro-3-deoxyphosphooctonate aldolase [Flavobacterium sp. 38-13]OJX49430.1 MAG: hypothetical protein BGO88_14385 [Flavobacterium sp. 38-13]